MQKLYIAQVDTNIQAATSKARSIGKNKKG